MNTLPIEHIKFPPIDPDANQLILLIGRKKSGKSVAARRMFRDWPNIDKFVIDPSGDADPGTDIGTVTLQKLPERLPLPQRPGEHTVTRWIANPASPTYRKDLDDAVGLALHPKERRTLVWIDEGGRVFPSNQTGPHAFTLLDQCRHWWTSAIICAPRPITVNPLALQQADRLHVYDLPGPRDRKAVAENFGLSPLELNEALDEASRRGPFWYVLLVRGAGKVEPIVCEPMPMGHGYKHAQQ